MNDMKLTCRRVTFRPYRINSDLLEKLEEAVAIFALELKVVDHVTGPGAERLSVELSGSAAAINGCIAAVHALGAEAQLDQQR